MNKIKYFIYTLLLGIIIMPNVYAKDANVTIETITKEEVTGYAEEISPASFSGTNLNINLKYQEVGDSIKYRLLFKNNDNEDYKLKLDNPDEYITYILSSNVIKKNATTEVVLTAKYNKEMPVEQRGESISKVVKVNIIDKTGKVLNPKTGQSMLFIVVVLLVLGITLYTIKTKKVQALIIAAALLLIPSSVDALNNLILTINTTYEIDGALQYNGTTLNDAKVDADMVIIKNSLENYCSDDIEDDIELDKVIIEPISENFADVKLKYPNELDNLGVQTSISIETDAETGDSRYVVWECSNNPEVPYNHFTYKGNPLTDPNILIEFASNNICSRFREMLETLDTECAKKLIGEPQVTTQQEI